jgi:hypothetical protein
MGTDIHMRLEVRRDGEWHAYPMDGARRDIWHKSDGTSHDFGPIITARNYDVFAILGNVRNGTGFAGVITGSGFPYLSDSRGLPADIAKDHEQDPRYIEDEDEDDGYGYMFGDHSFSWVTLDEVLAYDWDGSTKKRGCVSVSEFMTWEAKGRPDSWSGDTLGSMVRKVTHEQMRAFISGVASPTEKGDLHYCTSVEWEKSYREAGKTILEFTEWAIKETGAAPADIRMVFGFDS